MFYAKLLPRDAGNLRRGFSAMVNMCSQNGGARICKCGSDPTGKRLLADPAEDITETFFCLPKVCRCKDGTLDRAKLWVRTIWSGVVHT